VYRFIFVRAGNKISHNMEIEM